MSKILITGATSGIGEAFLKELDCSGKQFVLVARNIEKLNQLQAAIQGEAKIIQCDLSKADDLEKLFNETKDDCFDMIINNAGFGECSLFVDGDINRQVDMIEVNVVALHKIMKYYIPKMNKQGIIINVGSVAGLMSGGPYMATYYATKSYVVSLSMALAYELKGQVQIACLCPGPVDTNFNKEAGVKHALKGISPNQVVQYCLKKIKQNKVVIIPSLKVRLGYYMSRLLPHRLMISILARGQRSKIER